MKRAKPIPIGRYGGAPIHPGTILREDYLAPLGLTAYALAKGLTSRKPALAKSSPVAASSPSTLPYGWRVISAPRRSCGSTCNRPMTCTWLNWRTARTPSRKWTCAKRLPSNGREGAGHIGNVDSRAGIRF